MSAELKSFSTLFTETWSLFKTRAITLIGVFLLTTLVLIGMMLGVGALVAVVSGVTLGSGMQFDSLPMNLTSGLAVCLVFPVIMLVAMWSQSAMIAVSVDDSMGIGEAMKVGWKRLWAMSWILLLAGSIIMTGFLLFVIPGLIFGVSLIFALYPLYDQDLHGMDAVMASRRYVRGRWWNTFGKLILIWLVAFAINLIPLVGQFLYMLFTPFLLLFMVTMYRNLRDTCVIDEAGEKRGIWWLLAMVGMVLPVAGILAAVYFGGPQFTGSLEHSVMITSESRQVVVPPSPVAPPVPQAAPGRQPVAPVPGSASGEQWNDPVGDVRGFGVGQWLDLESVTVQTGKGEVEVELRTHAPLRAAFNAASTSSSSLNPLATLYFDSDVDRSTGGSAGREEGRTGYEYGLDVTLESPRNQPEQGQVHAGLFRFENGARRFLGPLPEGNVSFGENLVQIRIPYSMIGVHPGGQLRMSYLESAQAQGSGLSRDKLLEL